MENFKDLNFQEVENLRRKLIKKQDFDSLIKLTEYKIKTGSIALNQYYFPQLLYFYGRAKVDSTRIQVFFKENPFIIMSTDRFTRELSSQLFKVGVKFPHLNEQEMNFLEEKYMDSKTFELMEAIMHDSDLLPRPLKKLSDNRVPVEKLNFSKSFLKEIYNCFLRNAELDVSYDDIYIYSSFTNKIIRKSNDDIGYGEIAIIDPVYTNEFWDILKINTDEITADRVLSKIARQFNESLETIKNRDSYGLQTYQIESFIRNELYSDEIKEKVRVAIAEFWLEKVNED